MKKKIVFLLVTICLTAVSIVLPSKPTAFEFQNASPEYLRSRLLLFRVFVCQSKARLSTLDTEIQAQQKNSGCCLSRIFQPDRVRMRRKEQAHHDSLVAEAGAMGDALQQRAS